MVRLELCGGTVTKRWGWVGSGTLRVTPKNRFRELVGSQVGLDRLTEVIPSETHTGPELPPSPASGSTPPGLIREVAAPGHLLSARVTAERKAGSPRMELPHGRLPVLEVTTYSFCRSSGRRRGQDPRGPHGARSAVTALGHVPGMGRGKLDGRGSRPGRLDARCEGLGAPEPPRSGCCLGASLSLGALLLPGGG